MYGNDGGSFIERLGTRLGLGISPRILGSGANVLRAPRFAAVWQIPGPKV